MNLPRPPWGSRHLPGHNHLVTTEETRYVLDGLDTLAEIDPKTGSLLKFYVHGPGIDEPLGMWSAPVPGSPFSVPGSWHFYHADHLGSITEITDSSGSVVAQYRYSAFGSRFSVLDSLPPGLTGSLDHGFTGRVLDEATGLYHYRFRWYDPSVGRFLSEDILPVAILALPQTNTVHRLASLPHAWYPYVYARNDPVGHLDPWGLVPCSKSLCWNQAEEESADLHEDYLDTIQDYMTSLIPGPAPATMAGSAVTGDPCGFVCSAIVHYVPVLGYPGGAACSTWCTALRLYLIAEQQLDLTQQCMACDCP